MHGEQRAERRKERETVYDNHKQHSDGFDPSKAFSSAANGVLPAAITCYAQRLSRSQCTEM